MNIVTINGRLYRVEKQADQYGEFTVYIPCEKNGRTAHRCPTCGDHYHGTSTLGCGL